MYTVSVITEFEKVYYQSKFSGTTAVEPIQYIVIDGVKIRVASAISELSNEKVFTYKEEMNLRKRQSNKYLQNILTPKAEIIVELLKITF